MDPTKFSPKPQAEGTPASKEVPKQSKMGNRKVTINPSGIVVGGSLTQNIPATPPAAVPLSTSHKVAKPDPDLQFNQLLNSESKKTFSQQEASGNVLKIGEGGLHSAFHDIPCIKDTAIKVGSRYLHANDVTFKEVSGPKFIACSAPQTQDRELFWRAAFEQADTIVDVTGLGDVEGYFPEEKDKKIVFGKMTITCTDAGPPHVYRIHDGYSGKEKNITRIHFSKWPDKQAVTVEQLENLVHVYQTFCNKGDQKTIVHCRAGVGRTGTFMVAAALRKLYDAGELTQENANKMVHDLILEARTQRGPSCVQVLEQFELLCGYANKLVTEGPLETPNIVETLTDPNRIATTERALEVIHSIANRTATVTEQKLLTSALKIVAEALQHAEIKDPEVRTRLDEELETIRTVMATQHDQGLGYMVFGFEEPEETKETKKSEETKGKEIAPVRELTSQERDMVNFTRMLLESKVPMEVQEHDNYLGISLFTLGSTDVDRMHLPVEELKKKAIANAVVLLQGAHSLEPDKVHFILTPSTSASGPEGIEPFTLRCAKKNGDVVSSRLVYNLGRQGWQIMGGSLDYKILGKARVYPTLEKVISGGLANAEELPSDYVGITKEAFAVKRSVVLNDQEIVVPNLTLRGLCKAADVFTQELGDEAPFVLPSSVCSNTTFTACFNNLLYGLPFEVPAESGQKRAFLQEVTNLARLLGCSQLEAQLAPLRIQADAHFVQASERIVAISRLKEGEFILTEYNNKPVPTLLYMKVGAEIVEKLLEVDSKGGYRVSRSTQSYPDHNRLIRDIRQTEELSKLLEAGVHLQGTHNLTITPTNNQLSYPVRQHEVCVVLGSAKVSLPIALKADNTFTVGGIEGLSSFVAVEKALKTQCGVIIRFEHMFQTCPAFESGITLETAQKLLENKPVGTYLFRQEGQSDMRLACKTPEGVVDHAIGITPVGFQLFEDGGKKFPQGNAHVVLDELIQMEFPDTAMIAYQHPIQNQPGYHGQLDAAQIDKLFKENRGCVYLLRMSSDLTGNVIEYRTPKGKIEKAKIEISEEGIRLKDGKEWYKTPEAMLEQAFKVQYSPILNTKAPLLNAKATLVSITGQNKPQPVIRNELCAHMTKVWLELSPRVQPEDLVALVKDVKGVRLPTRDDLVDSIVDTIAAQGKDLELVESLGGADRERAIGRLKEAFSHNADKRVMIAKELLAMGRLDALSQTQVHDTCVTYLRQLIQPDPVHEAFKSHESLNAALKVAAEFFRIGGTLTPAEQKELAMAFFNALRERPYILLAGDEKAKAFALDKEFKEICAELWPRIGLGEFAGLAFETEDTIDRQ